MNTSSPQTPLTRVRTFASDLTTVRAQKNIIPTPLPVTTNTQTTPTKVKEEIEKVIPPFHTFSHLKKIESEVETNEVPKKTTPSISLTEAQKIITEKGALSKNSSVAEPMPAVIITDTKRKRFSFTQAVKTSLIDWWNDRQATARKNKVPKYTIPEADRRKGVIQKATVKTGRTSSADHAAVISRIKATKTIPHEPLVRPAVTEPTIPAWETAEVKPVVVPTSIPIPTPAPVVITPISNVHIEPKKKATDTASLPINNWESDLQTAVNSLTVPKPDSEIIITGKEFTKIKKQKAVVATLPPAPLPELPKIKPIVPVMPIIKEAVVPAVAVIPTVEIAPVITPKVAPVEVPSFAEEGSGRAQEFIKPLSMTRPKIVPVIPPQINDTPKLTEAKKEPATREILVPFMSPDANPAMPAILTRPAETKTERRFAPPRPQSRSWLTAIVQTNNLVFIISSVLIAVIVSGLGLRYYLATPARDVAISTESLTPATTFSNSTLFNEPTYISTKNELASILLEKSVGTDSLVEINFINSATNSQLSPQSFFTLFNISVLFDFESSLNTIALGGYRGQPWLTFAISDKTTALGGMLQWEKSLARDLSPIFGSGLGYTFTDNQINGNDVRVLKDSNGTEKITYGFVNNTLLITTNTTAFLNLSGNLQ